MSNQLNAGGRINFDAGLTDDNAAAQNEIQQSGNPQEDANPFGFDDGMNDVFALLGDSEDIDPSDDFFAGMFDDDNSQQQQSQQTQNNPPVQQNQQQAPQNQQTQQTQNSQQNLQQEVVQNVRQIIQDLQFTEANIPQDFDASDRGHLAQLMTTVAQTSVQRAIAAMMHPMQAALTQQQELLSKQINATTKTSQARAGYDAAFADIRDALAGDKRLIGMAGRFMQQAYKKSGNDARKAATATIRALQQFGVNIQPGSKKATRTQFGGLNNGQQRVVTNNKDMLDGIFGS